MKNILIVAAEQPSRFCSWHDRATCVLFGDGASAMVVTQGEGFKDFRLTGDTHTEVMYYKRQMERTPYDRVEEPTEPLVMNGREVFRLAVEACINDVDTLLERNGMTGADVDLFLLHQANMGIIECIREHLGQPKGKIPHQHPEIRKHLFGQHRHPHGRDVALRRAERRPDRDAQCFRRRFRDRSRPAQVVGHSILREGTA